MNRWELAWNLATIILIVAVGAAVVYALMLITGYSGDVCR